MFYLVNRNLRQEAVQGRRYPIDQDDTCNNESLVATGRLRNACKQVDKIMKRGENPFHQHFFPHLTIFSRDLFQGVVRSHCYDVKDLLNNGYRYALQRDGDKCFCIDVKSRYLVCLVCFDRVHDRTLSDCGKV